MSSLEEVKEAARYRAAKARAVRAIAKATDVPMPRWYVASCGDEAANRTGCLVEVEFFSDSLAYGRACRRVEKDNAAGKLDSFTMGEIE